MKKRQEAIQWWNSLSSLQKTRICDTNNDLIGSPRRWETLTGREIEKIYKDGHHSTSLNLKWNEAVYIESEDGTWEFINANDQLKLLKWDDDKVVHEIELSKKEWYELMDFIKQIS